jgi:hypothetical protein
LASRKARKSPAFLGGDGVVDRQADMLARSVGLPTSADGDAGTAAGSSRKRSW